MPKKQNFGTREGISSRPVLLVLGITLLAAIIIVVVFVVLSNRNAGDDQDYQNYLNQLRQQANTPRQETNQAGEEIPRRTVRGVLTEIRPDGLTVTTEGSGEKVNFFLRNDTVITYQNQSFDRARFFVGDQLQVIAREESNVLTAETITVFVSASPATPSPVPVTPNVSPSGSFRPLGVE